jgi:hypothetical protein
MNLSGLNNHRRRFARRHTGTKLARRFEAFREFLKHNRPFFEEGLVCPFSRANSKSEPFSMIDSAVEAVVLHSMPRRSNWSAVTSQNSDPSSAAGSQSP